MKEGIITAPRRLLGSLLQRPTTGQPVEAHPVARENDLDAIDRRGLFVIGAARSGTTVLQNALNDFPEIFLFGEPAFHDDSGARDFAGRYNAMHRAWGNQENKSSFCPALFDGDAAWPDYLCCLAGKYRLVGSKIVVNPQHAQENCMRIFDFHCRHFYRAHYIFTFRNPVDVLMSTRGLAELNGDAAASCEGVLRSFLLVIALYIRMLRNLPFVSAVFHESIGEKTFQDLGRALGIDVTHAKRYYDGGRVRHYSLEDIPASSRETAQQVLTLYGDLREQATAGFDLLQLDQNSRHFDIKHYTPIGALQRRVDQLLAQISLA